MNRHLSRTLLAAAAWALIASPAFARQAPAAPPATAAPAPDCSVPYAVGERLRGGEIAARFNLSAVSQLKIIPGIEAKGGAEVLRSAYAGMANQAMEQVWRAYACQLTVYVKAQNLPEADAKIEAVNDAIDELVSQMPLIQASAKAGPSELAKLSQLYLARNTRAEGAPVLDAKITDAALTKPEFISNISKTIWLGIDALSVFKVEACGGVVQAAISDGGSSLQMSINNARPILLNYLDPNKKPKTALSSLLNALATDPINANTPVPPTFKDCTKAAATPS